MMNAFSTSELAALQATQVGAMQDACQVLSYSGVTDDYGNPAATYTAGAEIACGVEMLEREPGEVFGSAETPTADVRLRLPLGTVISNVDRVRITKRFGVSVSAVDYALTQPAMRGPSGLRVLARQVG